MRENYNPNIEIPLIDKMHQKALELINENKINVEDFSDVYSDIDDDMNNSEARMKKWDEKCTADDKEMKKYATVLEAVVAQYIGKGWLGENVKAKNTADPDDLNGVDIISEFTDEEPRKYLGLAIDATFAKNIKSKFRAIKGGIVKNNLGKIKYFRTDDGQAGLTNVPGVVVGVELETIKEIGQAWIGGDEDFIKNHPVQSQIIDQILMQLDKFRQYADRLNKKEIADKYKSVYELIKKIKSKKIQSGVYPNYSKRGLMHKRIKKEMDDFLNDAPKASRQNSGGYTINDLAEKFNKNK